MSSKKDTKKQKVKPKHLVLREVLKHYLEYRDVTLGFGVAGVSGADGKKDGIIEHSYMAYDEFGDLVKETITISFWDLHFGIKDLAKRKREALFYNVILDQKQEDVAKKMGITEVSVGQYVDAATRQLAKRYFAEEPDEEEG